MPLILTWQYGLAAGVALAFSFLLARGALKYRLMPSWLFVILLMPISLLVILGCLWALGFHPIGFLVSIGGWILFILTLFIAQGLALLAVYLNRSLSSDQE